MSKNRNTGKLLAYIGIPAILLVLILRFVLFYFKSDGFSGMSVLFPLLVIGIIAFALLMSGFFAAWVYQDCKKRNDDSVLWAIIVFVTTPFIGLLVYFLRRSEVKRDCSACGHPVSLKANYCESCGSKMENKEEITEMEMKRTHHIGFIVMGIICMVLMLTCLTTFIVGAASGNGINSDVTSNEKIWNIGGISMNYQSFNKGVWKLDFKSASDGFIAEQDMVISNPESEYLYADIISETSSDGASLTLYLVQDSVVRSFDVTNLSESLSYSLTDFKEGKVHVRLLIEGVKDTVSEIYIR